MFRVSLKKLFVSFALIGSLGFWSFVYIDFGTAHIIRILIILISILYLFVNYPKKNNRKLTHYREVCFFIIIPFLTAIVTHLYNNQTFLFTVIVQRFVLLWLLYFLLHKWGINSKWIIKAVLVIGLIWAFFNIIQQFTYPYALFQNTHYRMFNRAGIYRFMPDGILYGIFAIFFFYLRFLRNRKILNLFILLFLLAGLYFYSARQYLASTALVLFVSGYFLSPKYRRRSFVFMLLGSIFLVALFDLIFGRYVEVSNDLNEDNIRLQAYWFFSIEYFPNNLARLFGNGFPFSGSNYGREYFGYINEVRHLFRSDVGIVGTYNTFGLIYVIILVFSFLKGIFKINKEYAYISLTFLFLLVSLPLSEWSWNASYIPFYSVLYYLHDIAINKKESGLQK